LSILSQAQRAEKKNNIKKRKGKIPNILSIINCSIKKIQKSKKETFKVNLLIQKRVKAIKIINKKKNYDCSHIVRKTVVKSNHPHSHSIITCLC